jgi:hypothetical protein
MGSDPTIPASKRPKTVHALDRSATVTGEEASGNMIVPRRGGKIYGNEEKIN